MIFNLGGNSEAVDLTADKVKYGNSNVAQELATLENELTANGKRIYLDYKDGKYGYNTDALRGADTFSPFKSGGKGDDIYTNLTTVASITGDKLPTIYGSGYITIRRIRNVDTVSRVNVYIDGNTEPFLMENRFNNGIQGDFYKFFFQESIRFDNGKVDDVYFYQTLLADELIEKKYNITQGLASPNADYITIAGKGKILVCPTATSQNLKYTIDGETEQSIIFHGWQYMEYLFNESFKFKNSYSNLHYIAYTEI